MCITLDAVFEGCYEIRCTLQRTKHFADPSVAGATRYAKLWLEILQSVNNRTQSLRKILRMVITDLVVNTLLGRVTRHPAGMHCPARDDAFVTGRIAAKRQPAGIVFTQ